MRIIGLALLTTGLILASLALPGAQTPAAVVTLELSRQFYYAGDSLNVRISVRNTRDEMIENPVNRPLFSAFKVSRSSGGKLAASGKASVAEPSRPDKLAPTSFYGATLNLTGLYPELGNPGVYEIYWSSSGVISNKTVVTVIPRFDPKRTHRGTIVTDLGPIEIEFYQNESPIAVKSFIDMARAGFYDGMLFQEVQPDSYIIGGDPRYAEKARRGITYPSEQSSLPLVAGTVVVKPVGAAPPSNGPEFIILLRPQTAWSGQVTVLGQVVQGLDLVQQISRVRNSGPIANPRNKPLNDIRIRNIAIEVRDPAAVEAPSTEKTG